MHTVSATQEPDLFWAVRGAFSNYGVLTSVTLKTYDVSDFSFSVLLHPLASLKPLAKWTTGLRCGEWPYFGLVGGWNGFEYFHNGVVRAAAGMYA